MKQTWWIVFTRELRDMWVGGKALNLVLIYTILLGIYVYLFAANNELQLMPLKFTVLEIVKASVAVGMFIGLIVSADSFSGERERSTLESLLLTPSSRQQIVLGKFLAALSPAPVVLAIGIPYWVVLSKGDPVLAQAILWGPVMGSLMVPPMVALGMLVSLRCNSNAASMLASLGIFLLLVLPPELLGPAPGTRGADMLQLVDPVVAGERVLEATIIENASLKDLWLKLTEPVLFAVLLPAVLFTFASRRVPLVMGPNRIGALLSRWSERSPRPAAVKEVRGLATTQPSRVRQNVNVGPAAAWRSRWLAWWVVSTRDLHELWVGGRALMLLLAYVVIVAVASFVAVSNSQLDLIPPKEMVWTTLQTSVYAGVFMGVIIGADTLSGARERARLETLLLSPVSRTQIVFGKLLAAMSPWPLALAVSFPFIALLAQGDAIVGPALYWAFFLGSLLVVGFTGLAMLVSYWCNSNRTSLFVSLTLYCLFLLPALLGGQAQKGIIGKFVQRANPLAAVDQLLERLVVNNARFHDWSDWLKSPVAFPVLVLALLLIYAAPRLALHAGAKKKVALKAAA
ncbi:MAG TPA: ABC transporter permease subunit [Gemmatimonadales bacterium]|nr:ABC transporter permease subunit [Gemmatimonadales bacterium]